MLENWMMIAQAAAPAAGGNGGAQPQGGGVMLLGWVAIFGVMIFFMFRSQRKQAKQRQEMLNQIKAGDRILTAGGIYGTVTKVQEGSYFVEIAAGLPAVEVAKSGIASMVTNEAAAK